MRIWVNGTFDILHVGHITLLKYAALMGSVRVGIDSDERVKKLKGNLRPINSLQDRIAMLESIKYVTDVVSYSSDNELILRIMDYRPDVIVVGSEYMGKVIGGDLAHVVYFDRIEPYSTTAIIKKSNNE
jgi:D-beta-D-heptose 7-phosphate kinase/D-beta-D-heptose 1-phosphate adenosyltransferase